MLKGLAILAGIVSVTGSAVLAYAASKPNTFRIARSMTIRAIPDKIFPLINDLHSFNTWNPFLVADPATKLAYSGPSSGKGAAHEWDGNSEVGKGHVEIANSIPSSKITMNLDMIEPMEAHNTVNFTLEPAGDATKVTWAMSGQQPLLGRVMTMFINCDKMVGGQFEKGLTSLKAIAEKS